MERLWSLVGAASRFAVWIGAAMLVAAALIVGTEIAARKAISPLLGATYNLTGSDEIASYLFAIGTSLSLAHVLVTKGHVRIDVLYAALPAPLRTACDILALLALALFVGVLLERAYSVLAISFIDDIRSNTTLRVPLWIPQAGWFAGIALFFAAIAAALLKTIVHALRGELATASATSGIVSTTEEVRGELESLGLGPGAAPSPESRRS